MSSNSATYSTLTSSYADKTTTNFLFTTTTNSSPIIDLYINHSILFSSIVNFSTSQSPFLSDNYSLLTITFLMNIKLSNLTNHLFLSTLITCIFCTIVQYSHSPY